MRVLSILEKLKYLLDPTVCLGYGSRSLLAWGCVQLLITDIVIVLPHHEGLGVEGHGLQKLPSIPIFKFDIQNVSLLFIQIGTGRDQGRTCFILR